MTFGLHHFSGLYHFSELWSTPVFDLYQNYLHIIVGLYQNVAAKSGIDHKKVFGLYHILVYTKLW